MKWQEVLLKQAYYPMTDKIDSALHATMAQGRNDALKIFNEFGLISVSRKPTPGEINNMLQKLKTLISTLEQDTNKLRQDVEGQNLARRIGQLPRQNTTPFSSLSSTTSNPLDEALDNSRRS
tara:strand:+ start:54 stop:419 length:366 start_codon:yes stop_codon:yes gene_type:complete